MMPTKPTEDRSWIATSVQERVFFIDSDLVWAAAFAARYDSLQRNCEYRLGTEDHERLIADCVEKANAAATGLKIFQFDQHAKKVEREQARRRGGSNQ